MRVDLNKLIGGYTCDGEEIVSFSVEDGAIDVIIEDGTSYLDCEELLEEKQWKPKYGQVCCFNGMHYGRFRCMDEEGNFVTTVGSVYGSCRPLDSEEMGE